MSTKQRSESSSARRRLGHLGNLRMWLPAIIVAAVAGSTIGQAATSPGTWSVLPPPPIDLARVQTGGWTGHEALFTFPSRTVRTAVAYNPATNRWRRLPGVPGPPTLAEGGDRSVWTGRDWLVFGQGPFVAYRPGTNRWRTLRPSPVMLVNSTVVWTGSRMIGWGGGCCGDFMGDGAEFVPATNAWRKLPPSPLRARQSSAGIWTGKEFIIVGGFAERVRGGVVRSVTFADAAAYNPTRRTWRRLPPMPAGRRATVVVWTGRELVVVGGLGQNGAVAGVFAYRPSTNTWRTLSPLPRARFSHAAVWTGRRLLVWGGEVERGGERVAPTTGLAYNPATNRWSSILAAPIIGRGGPSAVWTGTSMIVAGGGLPGADRAAMFTPGG